MAHALTGACKACTGPAEPVERTLWIDKADMIFSAVERARLAGLRAFSTVLASSGRKARLSVLIYHRVLPEPDPLLDSEPDAAGFERHMALLANYFNVLPLREAVRRLQDGSLPRRAACVTFDDGYADNAEVALPVLQRQGVPATFFVSTGFLDGGCMWNDRVIEAVRAAPEPELDLGDIGLERYPVGTSLQRRQAIAGILPALKYLPLEQRLERVAQVEERVSLTTPDHLMMTREQVRMLDSAGMEIGGHTVNHPVLTAVDSATARAEIADGKEELEAITGGTVRSFAYPNGKPGTDYAREHVEMVRSLGFETAVSTSWGAARRQSDPWQLPRFTPWDKSPERFMLRLLQNSLMYRATTV